MSCVCVRVLVCGESYAFPVEFVTEVAPPGEVTPVPGGPEFLLGVRNLRGMVVPVASLARLLGLEGEPEKRLVFCQHGARRLGLAVTEVLDVGALGESQQPAESSLLSGAALIEGTLVGVLDVPALMDAAHAGAGGAVGQ